ncbi:caspase recruitment domain-containing protein 11-like [Gadus chalcogrammus]|uniref:caspase recruitment domain-containing protein 11-like n=1 Tax=Gadus chalcogrammus TaxID=1042646 RepID=UPI0024C2ECC1|nr:caspase recruitment domain-containing protein 11-like [Gadus chalcogrammus]
MDPSGDVPFLGARCDDIMHVTDTRYQGMYQWRCCLLDRCTAQPLQQLLLLRLRTMASEQKNFKKKVVRLPASRLLTQAQELSRKAVARRVRLVKAVAPGAGGPEVLYTLSHRQEEQLIPYSLVQPVQAGARRPVLFSPSPLSRGLIEQLLQPAMSQLQFNTCPPEPIPATERCQKHVFMLNPSIPDDSLGIRLQSIQDIVSQDKHCLLELSLANVQGLLKQGVYPIVIHIQPKNKKKWFPQCGEEKLIEDLCRREELQLETLPLFHHTLEPSRWSSTDDLLSAIRSAIDSQQRAVACVEFERLQ